MNYGNFMPEVSPQKIQILLIYPSPGKLQKKMRTFDKIHLQKFIHNWLNSWKLGRNFVLRRNFLFEKAKFCNYIIYCCCKWCRRMLRPNQWILFASTNKKLKVGKKESGSLFGLPLKCVWVKAPKEKGLFLFLLFFFPFLLCFEVRKGGRSSFSLTFTASRPSLTNSNSSRFL